MDISPFHAVRAFHQAVDAGAPALPQLPDAATLALRRTLLHEEFAELMEALAGDDLAAIAGEAIDVLYVTYGLCVACGIDANAVFAAVQQANLAKIHGPRRSDGKQLKPADWQPPDVAGVLRTQLVRQNTPRTIRLIMEVGAGDARYHITDGAALHLKGRQGADDSIRAAYLALLEALMTLRQYHPGLWRLAISSNAVLAPLRQPQDLPSTLRPLDAQIRLLLAEYAAWSLELTAE